MFHSCLLHTRVASNFEKKKIWFMPKMLSRFYDRCASNEDIGAITLIIATEFRNIFRNPSAFGYLSRVTGSFSYLSCAMVEMSLPRIRRRISRKNENLFLDKSDERDWNARDHEISKREEGRRTHGTHLTEIHCWKSSSSFSAICAEIRYRR